MRPCKSTSVHINNIYMYIYRYDIADLLVKIDCITLVNYAIAFVPDVNIFLIHAACSAAPVR
jgi:hypothetical protein